MFGGKYCMSMFASKRAMEDAFMADSTVPDLDKLLMDFEIHKEQISQSFPQLYYCLLAVKDLYKQGYRLKK